MEHFHCYSKRLLNPFHGIVLVVESKDARAISNDGFNWRLQLRSEIYKKPWHSLAVPHQSEEYFIYGVWSADGSLARIPIHPTLYSDHVEEIARELIQNLPDLCRQVPFPLEDHYELWLMDQHARKPLVLVDSKLNMESLTIPRQFHWYPTVKQEQIFESAAVELLQKNATIHLNAHDLLVKTIKNIAGQSPVFHWYRRNKDGSGTNLTASNSVEQKSGAFPDLLIIDNLDDDLRQQLINDYITWLAPRLLTLQHLEDSRRESLEILAAKNPILVHECHRLYPKVIHQQRINAVLVEAIMRRSEHSH